MADFCIVSLGCKVNQSESESIARGLMENGWTKAGTGQPAQVCIINTCAVTGKASMQSRQEVRKAVRSGAKVYVTGCYAHIEPDTIRQINGVTGIFDNNQKACIHNMLTDNGFRKQAESQHSCGVNLPETRFHDMPLPPKLEPSASRTRALVKIQDGCNACCTYCIVPRARGPSRSLEETAVIQRLITLEQHGYHEIVLTGIHLGRYGLDLNPPTTLLHLLIQAAAVLTKARIRLSSLEPNEINTEIISFIASSNIFCHHFHIPLQSGDDEILTRMNRPYNRDLFRQTIQDIRQKIPQAAIGTDVLVGFPGESPRHFNHTISLIKELPLSYLHIFPFSSRPGTPAASLSAKNPPSIIKARCAELKTLGLNKKLEFYRKFIGTEQQVLIEGSCQNNPLKQKYSKGLTSNYIPVLIPKKIQPNSSIKIIIETVQDDLLVLGKTV